MHSEKTICNLTDFSSGDFLPSCQISKGIEEHWSEVIQQSITFGNG